MAAQRAALLLGCYRKADCADPEIFATAAIAVLGRYPSDVVYFVTDPQRGLPATSKWVPTIAELRDACEAENAAKARKAEQTARVKEQFAERERMEAMDPAEKRRTVIKREMAKLDAVFAAADKDRPAPKIDIRGMEECAEKHALASKLASEIERLKAASISTPMQLSDAALASLGVVPKSTPADTEGARG